MSASVPTSPSALKSAVPQAVQQLPARQAKKASMSASVPMSPSLLKSAELMRRLAPALGALPHELETSALYEPASPEAAPEMVRVAVVAPEMVEPLPLAPLER